MIIYILVAFLFAVCSGNENLGIIPKIPEECIPTGDMIDASGKIPSGILSGNIVDLGSFDQCLAIKVPQNNSKEVIRGKYCLMKIVLYEVPTPDQRVILEGTDINDKSFGLIVGWCIPEKCDASTLAHNISSSLIGQLTNFKVKAILNGMCQTEDDLQVELNGLDWSTIGFLIIFGVIIVISTIYDVYLHFSEKQSAHKLFIAFSIKTNGEKLFKITNNPDQLSCLHGIRFISMMWVLLGHRFLINAMKPVINLVELMKLSTDGWHMYIINASVAVDTFFLLSGLLVGYGYCLAKSKGTPFNIFLYYLHRYMRLTPVLAVIIFFHASLITHFGSGPFWQISSFVLKEPCVNDWWTPLLYIQNYYYNDQVCIPQTWYLAVDFQLFLLSPIILIPLLRWPKQTMIASTILLIGSVIGPFVVTYYFELSAFIIGSENNQDYMKYYYYATHIRYGPWLMGLMLGYYLFKLKKDKMDNNVKQYKLDTVGVMYGWLTSLTIMLICLFAGNQLQNANDITSNSFFNGFSRHGWSLGLCWVILACTQGYGGIVNSFLSWGPFQILGRFTYTIYLVHMSLQYAMAGATRTNLYFTDFQAMYQFWGDLMFSLAIAICLTLAFESPMITIEKLIFSPCTSSRKPKQQILPIHQQNTTNESIEAKND